MKSYTENSALLEFSNLKIFNSLKEVEPTNWRSDQTWNWTRISHSLYVSMPLPLSYLDDTNHSTFPSYLLILFQTSTHNGITFVSNQSWGKYETKGKSSIFWMNLKNVFLIKLNESINETFQNPSLKIPHVLNLIFFKF